MKKQYHASINLGTPALLLTIVFVILKLSGQVDWSWVWVFSPLWILVAFAFSILAIVGLGLAVALTFGKRS